MSRPRLLITSGDVAGIGPEVIAGAWSSITELADTVVIGDPEWMARIDPKIPVTRGSNQDLRHVVPGRVSAEAGRAAYDFLRTAIDACMAGEADGIVTAPLHKEGLRAAGVPHPGHTEILAERTGTDAFAMLLHGSGWGENGTLTVAHVTLHTALRSALDQITTAAIVEKIELLNEILPALIDHKPRIGVAGLNPHAGDGGLFGDEEARLIRPAVAEAAARGIDATGPWPADTMFVRAHHGRFDGVVAMYHDQGHIAMKLHSGWRLVNVTAGLPIVRTSVAHGTAYDIAGKGSADPASMVEAVRVAARLVEARKRGTWKPR